MRVLRGGNTDFVVLKDDAAAIDLVSHERTLVAPVRTRREFLERPKPDGDEVESRVHELLRLRRPVDIDRLRVAGRALLEEVVGHYVGEAEIVVAMKVGEEDRPDLLRLDASPKHPTHGPDSAVDQIRLSVDNEQRGRL